MHWILAAPFIKKPADTWLQPFVPGSRHSFEVVSANYDHDRSRTSTSARQWLEYLSHGNATWSAAQRSAEDPGIITLFPQLAVTVGLQKSLSRKRSPLLAWTFNVGTLYGGRKKQLAKFCLQHVDRFIVHSRREIVSYSEWLGFPPAKFHFVPLQRPVREIQFAERHDEPFVLSMGSAHRDYRLFFEVIRGLGYPTVVVAGRKAVEGMEIPINVTLHHDLSIDECHALVQKARINVVPIDNPHTASGQVTFVDSMMYGRPTVATSCIGTEDYAENGKTALLVKAGDPDALRAAVKALWEDKECRDRLGIAARKHVEQHLSDDAAGQALGNILTELENEYRR